MKFSDILFFDILNHIESIFRIPFKKTYLFNLATVIVFPLELKGGFTITFIHLYFYWINSNFNSKFNGFNLKNLPSLCALLFISFHSRIFQIFR
ncbi:hypothetical protein MsAc7_11710 [Methanolapillus millepedarum]|uniref:Uncharacterized protein n=1 Tax=Methanolapillus millepedarum TaxID=3028296 RepID=A0AA96V351_9EURY|nr:hypothetical protein MsAc7_11710 [Methanosarcinaceae archaeon Ac7]